MQSQSQGALAPLNLRTKTEAGDNFRLRFTFPLHLQLNCAFG